MINKFLLILILLFLSSCMFFKTNNSADTAENQHKMNPPDSLYVKEPVLKDLDSLVILHDQAMQTISQSDTFGAKVYFDHAMKIVSRFDEPTVSILMEWDNYDSLLQQLNEDYISIFNPAAMDMEAEEIRNELSELEESAFGDSTNIDTSAVYVEADSNKIPLEVNNRVELALKYFQTKGRGVFSTWLRRTGKYEKMVKEILKEEGVPLDLFYLAMIESGLNPVAYSYARASGMWQFIYGTGSAYGLRGDWWFDERRDPLLATRAAARHLRDLYNRFDDWYLALAGYNYSPGKIDRRIRIYNTRDFWQLKRLPRQTRNYVPTFIAAAIIAKNPEKYGFFVEPENPVVYDTVKISECVDLSVIAELVNSDYESLKELNPAIKRWCTPPGVKDFTLNLPLGTKEQFKTEFSKLDDDKKRFYIRHKIRSGETLSGIADKYRTSVSIIKSYNNISGTLIRAGHHLVIPAPKEQKQYKDYAYTPPSRYTRSSSSYKPQKVENVPGHKKIVYEVKKGDTLGGIAELYDTLARHIRRWNGLRYGQYIYPNQKLNIWVPEGMQVNSEPTGNKAISATLPGTNDSDYYVVKKGDTLWSISQKYNTSISELKKLNNLTSNKIKPGEKLVIRR